ncbi:hypothetical protein OWV82_025788 [Melia azedarach]|nr:hypothetical protein OWV82_025788 [Melia azedarach]
MISWLLSFFLLNLRASRTRSKKKKKKKKEAGRKALMLNSVHRRQPRLSAGGKLVVLLAQVHRILPLKLLWIMPVALVVLIAPQFRPVEVVYNPNTLRDHALMHSISIIRRIRFQVAAIWRNCCYY